MNRLNWVVMDAECKGLTCDITRMFKNGEYKFRVRGVNKFGEGVKVESNVIVAKNYFSECCSLLITLYQTEHFV